MRLIEASTMTTTPSPTAPLDAAAPPSVLSTLSHDGKRRWLKPRPSFGRFWRARRAVAYVLIAVFTAIPHMSIGGKPAVLLDLAARRFTVAGFTFQPTDTVLMALLMVAMFVGIFLVTALLGRVWCGWACPQTVYMEFVYRPIERLFVGTPGRTPGRLARSGLSRPLMYVSFLLVSMFLAHTFLAYFIGVERLRVWVTQSPLEHPTPFVVMAVVTGLMMFDFTFFREQTCIVACPYGRLQSVLLDRDSLLVTYDRARGEPRGKKRAAPKGDVADVSLPVVSTGDCVDCGLCVTTCPTGIDIRNGLQLECIGCAQCIDACHDVMLKLKRPTGLIRYSSQNAVEGKKRHLVRIRTVVYPILFTVFVSGFMLALLTRGPADVRVLRGVGAPFTQIDSGHVANPIRIKIVNRTNAQSSFTIALDGLEGAELRCDNPVTVGPDEVITVPAMIVAPAGSFKDGHASARVTVSTEGRRIYESVRPLVGPIAHRPGTAAPPHPAPSKEHDDE
jgi:cytochrome c oxidase accessory protein FixG